MPGFARELLLAALLLAGMGAQAAVPDCAQRVADSVAQHPSSFQVRTAQLQLDELGFSSGGVDGIWGSRTQAALTQFCSAAQFARSDDLLAMLGNHVAIYRSYPDWTATLASPGFAQWAAGQDDAAEIRQIVSAGDSGQVIWVLDRYRKYKSFVPVARSIAGPLFSYSLDANDFKALASTDEVLKRIGQLNGKTYSSMAGFDAALDGVLKGVADTDRYSGVVLPYAQAQDGLVLSDASFGRLEVGNVPDYVIQSLQQLKNLTYPGDGLRTAAKTLLDQLAARIVQFEPQIVKLAEISPSGARFTDASINNFVSLQEKGDPLAAAIADRLQGMKDVMYMNNKSIGAALDNVLMQEVGRVQDSLPMIVEAADDISAYGLAGGAMPKIKADLNRLLIPPVYLELLSGIEGADYPESDLFWAAARAQVAMAGSKNILKQIIFDVIGANDTLDDALLGKMKDNKVPPAVLAEIGTLKGIRFNDSQALEKKIEEVFEALSEQKNMGQYESPILAQARKQHEFDPAKAIQWSGAACNCVHDNLKGKVYGFYPYWLAGPKQEIDFSVLSRIEYFALGFDDLGNLPGASRWSGLDTGFIREARRYRSKIDLVIYRNDWKSWRDLDDKQKSAAFGKLATNIAAMLDMPLTDFASRAKPYVSFGFGRQPVRGDGVTLYFDGYPDDAGSVAAFVGFVDTLNKQLGAGKRGHYINIMFRSRDIGHGIYAYDKLLVFMNAMKSKDKERDGNLLVLLEAPTTTDKKKLRAKIEDGAGLHGENRRDLLRDVVTVVSYDGKSRGQLEDDVIYAGDNFGGIGFWPQPVATGKASAANGTISQVLHENFLQTAGGLASMKAKLCKFICPNRWFFRLAWDVFLLILLASAVLYATLCSWRKLFDAHFIHFILFVVVPFFLLMLALLFCDPSWKKIAGSNSPLIVVGVGIIGYAIWNYRDRKRKASLP